METVSPLDAFRTYEIPLTDLEARIGLDLDDPVKDALTAHAAATNLQPRSLAGLGDVAWYSRTPFMVEVHTACMAKLGKFAGPALVGATVLAMTVGAAGPAAARTVRPTDARDSPAHVDITGATYRDGEARASLSARVLDLQRTGTLVAFIGQPDSDFIYHATVSSRVDGTLATRLEQVTDASRTTVPCEGLTADWSVGASTASVSVPHACLRFGRFLDRHWMRVQVSDAGSRDSVRGLDVGRGSSPGCATAGEVRRLERGEKKVRVHELLDTDGRFGDGAAGGYSRVYRSCSGGRAWFVDYDGTTNRLLDTGRVRAPAPVGAA